MNVDDTCSFYDELADQYHLIFEDWDVSMQRQGQTILSLLQRFQSGSSDPIRVLDVAAGIGTQSLPLAKLGCEVSSRDLSPVAVARLAREAALRRLSVDAAVSDMRTVHDTVSRRFDAVIAFDNSVPHLLTDADILSAFRSFYSCLRPGGTCLLSVRDYERVTPGADLVHAYGIRWHGGVRHLPLQVWTWIDSNYYDLSLYIIVDHADAARVRRMTARYYAISISRLLALLAQAGFTECQRLDESIYQPILAGRKPAIEPA